MVARFTDQKTVITYVGRKLEMPTLQSAMKPALKFREMGPMSWTHLGDGTIVIRFGFDGATDTEQYKLTIRGKWSAKDFEKDMSDGRFLAGLRPYYDRLLAPVEVDQVMYVTGGVGGGEVEVEVVS